MMQTSQQKIDPLTIIDFATQSTAPEESRPLAERILAGDPRQRTWNHYSDPTGQFHAGVWQGEPGAWRVRYETHEEEFCILLEGQVRLTESSGAVREFGPGASFVVPGGFTGVWENLTRVRKAYAIGMLKEGTQ
jgi:uncharacterized cupin superfamily protein